MLKQNYKRDRQNKTNILSNSNSQLDLPATALFGTDGIRGRVGDLLDEALAWQVGFWTGQVLQQQTDNDLSPVIVGQDSRNSSEMLATALSQGLVAAGLDVWHIGLCPTPGVAYLTSASNAAGGVMISASHNPPEDNGIKIFGSNGAKLSQPLQEAIEAGIRGKAVPTSIQGQGYYVRRPELVQKYVESLKVPLSPNHGDFSGMRVVLDLAWGAAVGLAPSLFRDLGAEVICLHDRPDGDRINVNCGSTHLGLLKTAVNQNSAHLGFAFDGDADRVLAVDCQGRPVDGDYILYLWGQTLRQAQKLPDNLIISTVMANLGFERAWQKQGGKLIRTAVGDQYVQAEMVRTGGMLGGEQSGHILCRHYGIAGDGLLTALHLAALVRQAGVSLTQLVDQSFQTYPQLLRNVRVENRDRRMNWQQCEPLQKTIAQAEAAMGDRGRILVRASGTEPVIRVMVEAACSELTHHWTETLVSAVEKHVAA
ncbi:MAG: Phosphoglucosamine mutase [Chroococcidiopsis cubana SAG 39.79]|jgi:phosphoglucosamine mutase|uniref:Phosphoglucosamine mutase n=2 Tax=Chroococcidiopsis TaxID=54298 RepID=K9U3I1_CHRTP|nr:MULTISPECIES: phosphoglucosamine mutase [Chroococcidiopsis]PSB48803.1 phosphoglucosamine mutase [Cyanosarcina cf. burmensis CCALA 770]AFY89001.1 phosphoglucosamine mutase [Chroococcidiopsis thermalis PCC 7203]MDZ4871137.1 Phosphoglucosamine mutase [Chroococcidiopsis cubana SAG 39.79]PSB66472.1 phosphoglucosamine mutase [Chroococcidiopsis cubana CCALA 043]RUT13091.1 phosphoglucosamine mutase [Chroococcidiopsis cubana SAG 39.79]